MIKIDAHQHFWRFDAIRDSWIDEKMKVIQQDFMPEDLEPILRGNGLDGCVTVQSDQSEKENEFHLAHAAKHNFVKGIVGWVDLRAGNIVERLDYYSSFRKMKGFRHVLQGETDRALMLTADFKRGIAALQKHGFTYDLLIFPDQINYCKALAASFPEQKFVIDHIAKPDIKNQKIDDWAKDIKAIALLPNVFCKISGMITAADWQNWQSTNFTPYLDVITNAFGMNRIIYGSDWPVCLVASDYGKMMSIVKEYFSKHSPTEQDAFFGGNAIDFYNL